MKNIDVKNILVVPENVREQTQTDKQRARALSVEYKYYIRVWRHVFVRFERDRQTPLRLEPTHQSLLKLDHCPC